MPIPIRTCVICSQEFELKPDKPGFANRCPECSAPESAEPAAVPELPVAGRREKSEVNEARRRAIRDLLYRNDG
jgi:hypothetical protein